MKTLPKMFTVAMIFIALVLIAPPTYALETARVSVSTAGTQGNNNSFQPDVNENGQFVAFHSFSNNLVTGDTNNNLDVFVRNRQTGETTRVSVATAGTQGNNLSRAADISNDGNLVSFESDAINLLGAGGDTNARRDIFVRDRQAGTTTRVSVATGGGQVNGNSFNSALSGDGRFVAFDSVATNLVTVDGNGAGDVFVHDRQTGATTQVSVATGGGEANGDSYLPAISNDGRFVAFHSLATNLVAGDTNGGSDVFVHDRQTGETTRVSVATGGGQGTGPNFPPGFAPAISDDGRFVTFESSLTNLVTGDTNGQPDVFVHDRQTGTTTRVSVPTGGSPQANLDSVEPAISGDGRFVVFLSFATNLVPGGTSGIGDVFVHDRQTNTTTQMSVSTEGVKGNDFSCNPAISQDGRIVAIFSDATNLIVGDTNGARDIFIRDRTVDFDLDLDGKADLVWRDSVSGAVAVWQMNGLTIGNIGVPGGAPTSWTIAGVGDVDGDGKADLVWRDSVSGTVAVWQMNGLTIGNIGVPGGAPTSWTIAGVGDVDGDDKADLVWRDSVSGTVAVWQMNGLTIGNIGVPGGAPTSWTIAGVGDVDGDDKADLVWRDSVSGTVAVWQMNGLTIGNIGVRGAPTSWTIAGVGDVTGDGKADLVWRDSVSGTVAVWQMNGLTIGNIGVPGGAPTSWTIAGVGDVTGDGKADLVWHDSVSGAVAVWQMNGLTIGNIGVPGGEPTSWEIQ